MTAALRVLDEAFGSVPLNGDGAGDREIQIHSTRVRERGEAE